MRMLAHAQAHVRLRRAVWLAVWIGVVVAGVAGAATPPPLPFGVVGHTKPEVGVVVDVSVSVASVPGADPLVYVLYSDALLKLSPTTDQLPIINLAPIDAPPEALVPVSDADLLVQVEYKASASEITFILVRTALLTVAGTVTLPNNGKPLQYVVVPHTGILFVLTKGTVYKYAYVSDETRFELVSSHAVLSDWALLAMALAPDGASIVFAVSVGFGTPQLLTSPVAYFDLEPLYGLQYGFVPRSLLAVSFDTATHILWISGDTLYVFDYASKEPVDFVEHTALAGTTFATSEGLYYYTTNAGLQTVTRTPLVPALGSTQVLTGCNATVLGALPWAVFTQCTSSLDTFPANTLFLLGSTTAPPPPPPLASPPPPPGAAAPPPPGLLPILPNPPPPDNFKLILAVAIVILAVCVIALAIPLCILARRSKWYIRSKRKRRAKRKGILAAQRPAHRRAAPRRPPVPRTHPELFPDYGSMLSNPAAAPPGPGGGGASIQGFRDSPYTELYSPRDVPAPHVAPLPTVSWASSFRAGDP